MLIVACQVCGETKVIAGTADIDGMARAMWICPECGTGQVVQLPVSADARKSDLRAIVRGMALVAHGGLEECQ
ncbi:MAG: alcohol dehydrogenase [Synergistaceae bacterium]|nr:alcohol dehydrogenase [Synergistota bacterium]NLM71030.1 alcohol dehydrogenase [Synergistaceae bacterium]